jgi:imidazolonepropionase-like amidohydrolase
MKILKTSTLLLCFIVNTILAETVKSDKYVLLKDATIIDMVSDKGQLGDILIKGQQIYSIDYSGKGFSQEPSITYNLTGKYIIPGLIDNHVHITHGTYDDAKAQLNQALKNGVTGVRDMGGDGRMLVQLKRDMQLGESVGSDIYFSTLIAGKKFFDNDPRPGQVAKGAQAGNVPWQWAISDKTDYDNIVTQAKGSGATAIKIYTDVTPDQIDKVTKAANTQGLKVWAHAAVAPGRPSDIINSGVDVVSHAGDFIQYQLVDEVKDRYAFKSSDEAKKYRSKTDNIHIETSNPKVRNLLDSMKNNNVILDATLWVYNLKDDKSRLQYAQNVTKLAYENGVKIAAGSDNLSSKEDVNIHTELKLLTEAGLTNLDALKAATIINAEGIGELDLIGTVESGKIANLLVLNKNPLNNINNTRSIKYVIKRGQIHDGISSMHKAKKNQ